MRSFGCPDWVLLTAYTDASSFTDFELRGHVQYAIPVVIGVLESFGGDDHFRDALLGIQFFSLFNTESLASNKVPAAAVALEKCSKIHSARPEVAVRL